MYIFSTTQFQVVAMLAEVFTQQPSRWRDINCCFSTICQMHSYRALINELTW